MHRMWAGMMMQLATFHYAKVSDLKECADNTAVLEDKTQPVIDTLFSTPQSPMWRS